MAVVEIEYFSDVLCVWAYAAQRRVEQLAREFGEDIAITSRFCSVFPDAHGKIETGWKNRGGFAGFGAHVAEVADRFPHISVSDRLWSQVRPRTSASAHLFLKSVESVEREDADGRLPPYLDRTTTRMDHAVRRAFFEEARDISDWGVLRQIASEQGMDYDRIMDKITSSEAVAAMTGDIAYAHANGITGSPTYLMNDGRQKLFGNVGYRLIEANVQELLRNPAPGEASWC